MSHGIPILRDYQDQSVQDVRYAYKLGYKSVCLVLPTGGGKTIVFAYIAFSAAQKGNKVLILVHRKELLRQTVAKLKAFGIDAGIISPQYRPNYNAQVYVAMVQTMVSRGHLYDHFDLIVTDECHHVVAGTYTQSISRYPDAHQLGVTATPIRTDGKGLGRRAGGVYDYMVVGPQTADLISAGYLVEPVIHIPPSLVDMTGVRNLGGEYNNRQTAERVDKRSITGDAMEHYRSSAMHVPAVVFCVSVAHAEHVAAEWRAGGIKAYAVDGGQRGKDVDASGDDRVDRILRGLADGSVDAVMSCDLISEGTDIPSVGYMGDLGPTKSLGKFLQKIGRTLRPCAGKDRAIIMDHVGNVGRMEFGEFVPNHGLPTDVREWSLDGVKKRAKGKKENEGPSITTCENCYGVFVATDRVCPYCGAERVVKVREMISQTEGNLVELTGATAKRIEKVEKRREQGRAQTLEQLEAIAKARGYKPGWAKHVFEAKQNQLTK